MTYKKLNCKDCGYKYCPFHGSDREIPAYFCEDFVHKQRRVNHEQCFDSWHGHADKL